MATRAKELEATGEAVYALSLGEPDFDTPKHICGASVKGVKAGNTHYTAAGGIVELKTAVTETYGQLSTTVRSDLTRLEAGGPGTPWGWPEG
jgi:aspartate/methionine/tyrosine aminotransferase